MERFNRLAHSIWDCKYHIVWIPKYRRKELYGVKRRIVVDTIKQWARIKGVEIIEGHAMPDHIHLCVPIPPKYSAAHTIGLLKGKSESDEEVAVLSCPVRFDDQVTDESDPLKTSFLREIQAMRPWYDMALKKRGRTTLGGSGIDIDRLGEYIYAYVKGEEPHNPLQDVDPSVSLKLAVEDLKGYYVEAVTAQPGQEDLSSKALKEWLWDKTTAGEVLVELIKTCSQSENEKLKMMGTHFIAPMDVMLKRDVIKPGV